MFFFVMRNTRITLSLFLEGRKLSDLTLPSMGPITQVLAAVWERTPSPASCLWELHTARILPLTFTKTICWLQGVCLQKSSIYREIEERIDWDRRKLQKETWLYMNAAFSWGPVCEHAWGKSSLKSNSLQLQTREGHPYGVWMRTHPVNILPSILWTFCWRVSTGNIVGPSCLCAYICSKTHSVLFKNVIHLKPQRTQQNSSLPSLPCWRPSWISNIKCFHKNCFFTLLENL